MPSIARTSSTTPWYHPKSKPSKSVAKRNDTSQRNENNDDHEPKRRNDVSSLNSGNNSLRRQRRLLLPHHFGVPLIFRVGELPRRDGCHALPRERTAFANLTCIIAEARILCHDFSSVGDGGREDYSKEKETKVSRAKRTKGAGWLDIVLR